VHRSSAFIHVTFMMEDLGLVIDTNLARPPYWLEGIATWSLGAKARNDRWAKFDSLIDSSQVPGLQQ